MVLKYAYNENRNKNKDDSPLNSEDTSGKIVGDFEKNSTW